MIEEIKTGKAPIKNWATGLEKEALAQAMNLAHHPYTVSHIALMPDCHSGYGMPIGGVLAARNVILPNAVGVDIGCFSGDTKIPLLDGSQRSLKELSERNDTFWVYSIDSDLNVVPGLATAHKTRESASLIKVIVSGGDEIICTPDHEFMLIDGSYREAQDLDVFDSLMPLYKEINHKVISVTELSNTEDVYCLTVDTYHNFALSAGVFVHNCGVHSVQTDIQLKDLPKGLLIQLMKEIREDIPVGLGNHNKLPNAEAMPLVNGISLPVIESEWDSAMRQVGTLGAGNHFIELEKDAEEYIHVTIHSGSRNLGKQVADHYINEAKAYTANLDVQIPSNWDLAVLPPDHKYMDEMDYCLRFARSSREVMSNKVIDVLGRHLDFDIVRELDIHHNYASLEDFNGMPVWVHRKGATSAARGELGIIPGSQGTPTYIVEGRGNPQSFNSCSHGAGRRMGRNQAKKILNLESEQAAMEGILHSVTSIKTLDEAPGAYKNIQEVINNQLDLIKPIQVLYPIACIKG